MTIAEVRRSPLALAVLGLLAGGPLHPYRMQRLLKEWGKDQVINVGQRANLYSAIRRLHASGAIAVGRTERDPRYPERTVYEITDSGRALLRTWLAEMVTSAHNEFPEFPAALSFLMLFGPQEAAEHLATRAQRLRARLAFLDAQLADHQSTLPRVTLVETEYQRAVLTAEVNWLDSVLNDLRSGKLTWSAADFATAAPYYDLSDDAEAHRP